LTSKSFQAPDLLAESVTQTLTVTLLGVHPVQPVLVLLEEVLELSETVPRTSRSSGFAEKLLME
jgi:hypothetical protein